MTARSGRRGRRVADAPLNRRAIAEAALRLIDAGGLEALSMRQLGAALHVEAMALYHHYRNKAELLDGVLDLLLDEADPALDGNAPALARLRRCFEAMRGLAISHPRAFWVLASRRFRTPRSLEFYERLLQAFRDAGFGPLESARYFRVLAGFVVGAGMAEVGSRALQGDATPILLEKFSDARYPRISEVVPHLRVARLEAIFDFGLDLLFEDMERALRKR
jgi:AcrR family transcriptional regulator